MEKCNLKLFLEPLAQELEMDLLTLRDGTESQLKDHDMFWGNYIFEWYIDKNILQPVWRNGCPTYRTVNIDTVLVVVEKNADENTKEHKRAKKFDKYILRCQKKQVNERLSVLRAKYPNMVVLGPRCDDGNAIHVWNRFEQGVLTKGNYYRNHFRLSPGAEELFGIYMD